jgi:hypothetical protein
VKRLADRRPSPALVIACLALFVSLGGVSYGVATGSIDSREVKDNTVRTQDLRNNDIRGLDIRNSTVRTRDVALNTLTGADINEERLDKVPAASNADTLGGLGSDAFLRPDGTGFQALTLGTGWETAPGEAAPSFDVDPLGYVHLRGSMTGGGSPALTLPEGARPATKSHFITANSEAAGTAQVTVEADGDVIVRDPEPNGVSLDGVTFRAG